MLFLAVSLLVPSVRLDAIVTPPATTTTRVVPITNALSEYFNKKQTRLFLPWKYARAPLYTHPAPRLTHQSRSVTHSRLIPRDTFVS